MKKLTTLIWLFIPFALFTQVQNQEVTAYKTKYPHKKHIQIKDVQRVLISIDKNDSLIITTTHSSENIFLDRHANNYSNGSVSSSYFNKITDIKASSFEPVSETKYKEHKVKTFKTKKVLSSTVFFDDDQTMTFNYPSLIEGGKTKLEYVTRSVTPQLISAAYFGSYATTELFEYSFSHPVNVKMDFRLFNGADTLLTYTKTQKKKMITHHWELKNVQPLKNEGSTPSVLATIPHVYPIINSYTVDGKEIKLLGGIDELHNWYTSLLHQMKKDTDYAPLQNCVDSLVKDKTTDLEKVAAIYEFAQKDIKYVAYEDGLGGFVPRSPMTVYDRKYGDCKDMASLQVKMLELAGITGYVAWVGTRSKPYTYAELPTPGCDNHMIATYKDAHGKWYSLDATGTYSPFGYPSEFIQEKELMVHISDDTYKIVKVELVSGARNLFVDEVTMRLNGETLEGEGVASFNGYQVNDIKYRVLDKDSVKRSNALKSKLEKGSNKFFFTLKSYDLNQSDSGSVAYSFVIEDYVKKSGDEIYLNLNLERLLSTEKIDAKRENPLELDYLKHLSNRFVFDLEDKYDVTFLPKNKTGVYDGFNYSVTYERKGNQIIYELYIELNKIILEVEDFDQWNEMIKSLNKKYKEVVILKTK